MPSQLPRTESYIEYAGAYAAIREGVGAAVVVVMVVACRTGFSRESPCGVWGMPDESRIDLKDHTNGHFDSDDSII